MRHVDGERQPAIHLTGCRNSMYARGYCDTQDKAFHESVRIQQLLHLVGCLAGYS